MGVFDRVGGFFSKGFGVISRRFAKDSKITTSSDPTYKGEPRTDFGGTRTTRPKIDQFGVGNSLPKKTQRELGIDERRLQSLSLDELIDTLSDAHPDIGFALWNFLRLGNTDFTITVKKLNGKPDKTGERLIEELLNRLEAPNIAQFEPSRSIKKVLNQLFQSVVTRGACALELVLTPDYKDVAFFAPVDPSTIEFRFENDRYVPYQDDISLDIPTFLYETLDERIDDPYGRSPILGAINMVMFQMQVLDDIKRVVHNQGYPRFDFKILEEVLTKRMPVYIKNNEELKQKWLNDRLQEIIDMYKNLDPDDSFVHFDSVEINMVGGGKNGGAMIDPQKLMNVIDHLIMAGLKTLSTILGRRSTGNTESFAKMEIKMYLKGVEAIQDVVERIMSRALTLYLNIRGKQGIVEFKYKPVEIRTELEREQFEQIRLQNIAYKRDQGWIDQNEAAQEAVGHDAVSDPNYEGLKASQRKNKDGSQAKGQKDEKGPEEENGNDS